MAELKQELVYQQALLRRSRRDLELQRLRQEEEISQAREGLQQTALELQSLAKQRLDEDQTLLKELRQLGQASALRRQLAEELESLRSQAAALRHEARRFEDCATELQREVQALLS